MIVYALIFYSLLLSSYLTIQQKAKINEQETVFADVAESILSLEDIDGKTRGTGFVTLAKSGEQVIITNAHICELNLITPIFLVFGRQGESLRSLYKFLVIAIKKDDAHDLCIVSVPPDLKVKSLPLADKAIIDSHIYIIGYPNTTLLSASDGYIRGYKLINEPYEIPFKLCIGKKHYIKTDSIKNENGKIVPIQVCYQQAEFMFTDALGEFGQSGSPGLNGDGEVIGVMSMIVGRIRPFALLVPLSSLKEFLSTY